MKPSEPRKVDNFTADALCENCGCELSTRKFVWVMHEHLGCSKKCVDILHGWETWFESDREKYVASAEKPLSDIQVKSLKAPNSALNQMAGPAPGEDKE